MKRLPLATLHAKEDHVQAFRALAHEGRLAVFFALVKAKGELAAGEIQSAVNLPGPTVSHHLDHLRAAGLLESRRQERFVYYKVSPEMVKDLIRLLTACC